MHDSKVRVWLIVPQLDYVAGVEQHVTGLALSLAGAGHGVSVLSRRPVPPDAPFHATFAEGGVRLVDTGAARAPLRTASAPDDPHLARMLGNARRHWPGFRELEDLYLRHEAVGRPDIVHVHGFRFDMTAAVVLAAARHHPVVYTDHATFGEGDRLFAQVPDAAWAFLDRAGAVTCVSEHTREVVAAMVREGIPVEPARHVIRPPGPPSPRPSGTTDGTRQVVCLSRLVPEKGIDVLLDAHRILVEQGASVQLALAGGGADLTRLAHVVEGDDVLRDRVRIRGGYRPAELDEVLRDAYVVVSSSHTEGLPLSIVEAFARSVPVVATAVGGSADLVVDGRNGYLVPPANPGALAGALARVITDPATRDRLAAGALATYLDGGWSPPDVLARTLGLYDAVRSASSSMATARTAAMPRSQVYRSWYRRVASATTRLRRNGSR